MISGSSSLAGSSRARRSGSSSRIARSAAKSHRSTYLPFSRRRSGSSVSKKSLSSGASTSNSVDQATSIVGTTHIVCAVSENLARETCVASLDMGAPASMLQVAKQLGSSDSGGATYQETMAYLALLDPHEVLLNEGRRNSPLARKVLQLFEEGGDEGYGDGGGTVLDAASAANGSIATSDTGGRSQGRERDRRTNERNDHRKSAGKTQTVVKFVSRSFFDQTKGADLLRRVAREDTFDATIFEEYILLSSAYAVLHYTQHELGANYARNCVRIHIISGGNGRVDMDRATMAQLELLTNAKTGRSSNSLFDTMDHTRTSVGARLLRVNLISPPANVETVETRLALLDEFLVNSDFFFATLEHLERLPAIDKMMSYIAMVPKVGIGTGEVENSSSRKRKNNTNRPVTPVEEARQASKGISALICIKTTLAALPSLTQVLSNHLSKLDAEYSRKARAEEAEQNSNSDATVRTSRASLLVGMGDQSTSEESQDCTHPKHRLLRAIISSMLDPALEEILLLITEVFTESTRYSRNANAMRHQECFAFKSPDEHDVMNVLRNTFLSNIDDIYQRADAYAEAHGLHVTVRYTTTRGYFLSVPVEAASTLPNIFIQPSKSGKFIFCTTEEVDSLNLRAQDNVRDLLIITYEKTCQILEDARAKYDSLAALSDAIALLDLCHSLADKVTLNLSNTQPWTRPVVQEHSSDSAIKIVKGRFGIDVGNLGELAAEVSGNGSTGIVANDTYVSKLKPFVVISGVNGSGKSFYIKQIAIIVILAQCGSYVPAEFAQVPVVDRICARVGTNDDPENNISSFMMEMRETAFLCNHATDKSLILIDELGRATSNEDGAAIAWSVSEYLLSKGCFTFFVTHYPQLCQLSSVYSTVENQHMKAHILGRSQDEREIKYTYQVRPGPCEIVSDYGIDMAMSCGWPKDVVKKAREIERRTKAKFPNEGYCRIEIPDFDVSLALQEHNRLEGLADSLLELAQTEQLVDSFRSKLKAIRMTHIQGSSTQSIKMMQQHLLEPEDIGDDQSRTSHRSKNSSRSSHKHRQNTESSESTNAANTAPAD